MAKQTRIKPFRNIKQMAPTAPVHTALKGPVQINETISLSPASHAKLLSHVVSRLQFANTQRKSLIDRWALIDRELSGYIQLSDDDKKRKADTDLGRGPKPYAVSIQFTEAHLDEIVTFLMSVLFPDDGMYKAITEKDKQDLANGFSSLLNKHAQKFGHYRQLARAVRDMLVYNIGGNVPDWRQIRGTRIKNSDNKTEAVIEKNAVIFEGNAIDVIDMYNFMWDVAVTDIVDLKTKGEFFALVEPMQPWRLNMMLQRGEIYNLPENLETTAQGPNGTRYYYEREVYRHGSGRTATGSGGTNYVEALSGGTVTSLGAKHELVSFYGWLNPKEMGLGEEDELQVWILSVLNSDRIIFGAPVKEAHGMLPVTLGMPWEDGFALSTNSIAERLIPLQRFASHEMNIRQEAARKALYGVLFYDKNVIPFDEKNPVDLTAGSIPVKLPGQDKDIRRHINYVNHQPQVGDTGENINLAVELMNALQPANNPQQVADIDRATQYQAAATVQGSNRRGYKIAKIIDDQAFTPLREMQAKNILAFQPSMKLLDPAGNPVEINPSQLRDAEFEFAISEGMKGIDRMIVALAYKELIGMILQSQYQTEIDVIGIIDYYSSLLGDKVDFGQFRHSNEFDALPLEAKQMAVQLLQQATAAQQEAEGGGEPAQ